jgi:hypothetical protein
VRRGEDRGQKGTKSNRIILLSYQINGRNSTSDQCTSLHLSSCYVDGSITL